MNPLDRIVKAWASLALSLMVASGSATVALLVPTQGAWAAPTETTATASSDTATTDGNSGVPPTRYQWRFGNPKALQDGSFTANAWKVGELNELVFRRKDQGGADRETFLKSLRNKVLKIQYADTTIARVKVTELRERGDEISLACARLVGAQDTWHWNLNETYTVQTDDSVALPSPPVVTPTNVPIASNVPDTAVKSVTDAPAKPVTDTPTSPAPAAAASVTPAGVAPGRYFWRFRTSESMVDGAFTANSWQIRELAQMAFRRLDHEGNDRSALLLESTGRTLVIRHNNTEMMRAKITNVKDQGNQVLLDCERLGNAAGDWISNEIYSAEFEGRSSAPPATPPAAISVADKPAAAVPAVPDTTPHVWRFRNSEALEDGSFSANAWRVFDLKELAFRRIDHEGVDRSAYLLSLQGKTVTIRQGEVMIAHVRITSAKADGNLVGFVCENLSNSGVSWRYDKVYTIQVDADTAKPAGSGGN